LYAAEGEGGGRCEREKKADSSGLSRLAAQGLGSFAKPLKNAHWIALALLALALSVQAASPTDDFYLARLAAGRAEAAAGRHLEATDELRIAVFGFLDQPALLLEGLGRLALSQVAAGRSEAADETLRRLVEVASRFDAWEATELGLASRSEVASLVARRLGAEAARSLTRPTLTPTPTPVPTVLAESGRPAPTLAARPSLTVSPTSPPGPLPTVTPTPSPTRVAALPPTPAPGRAAEKAPPRETPSPTAVLAESRRLVERGRYVENLRRLVAAVAADPANRELRKALLEGAVLTKDWGTAMAQMNVLRPFQTGEEPSMFYAAVALEETGAGPEARALIEKALPTLKRTPFIDFYAKKILGYAPRK
jgi:tetratricopeptide (TPR) repeat protein